MDTRKTVIVLMVTTIGIVLFCAVFTLSAIKKSFESSLSSTLQVVRNSTHESVGLWASENEEHIHILSKHPRVIALTEELLAIGENASELTKSDAQQDMRELLDPDLTMHKMRGFFIIGPNNISLASTRNSNIGTTNLLTKQSAFIKRLWDGEVLITLPQPSDVPLLNETGIEIDGYPTMFVGGPIKNKNNEIIALLTLRLDPIVKLRQIVSQGKIGHTGETYLINKKGVMVTESRFTKKYWQRVEIPNKTANIAVSSFSNEKIHNPPLVSKQLTEMAIDLLKGNSGTNTSGYLDYRGKMVVGSWIWDPLYEYGLVTELDIDEAFLSYTHTKYSFISFTCAAAILFLLIGLVLYRLISRINSQEIKYRNLFENAGDPILISDQKTGCILSVNAYACEFLQYSSEELIGEHLSIIRPESNKDEVAKDLQDLNKNGYKQIETLYKSKQGNVLNVEISAKIILFGAEEVIISIIRDITQKKATEKNLLEMVNTDILTGLGNLSAFNIRLNQMFKDYFDHDNTKMIALFFLDIDNFKIINNTLGHITGDITIKAVGQLLQTTVPEGHVFRLSGDEFIILSLATSKETIEQIASNIHHATHFPLTIDTNLLHVTFSMGVSIAPDNGLDTSNLLQCASAALNSAKQLGKNRSAFFSKEMREKELIHMNISSALNDALQNAEFTLVFQPVVTAKTGELVGAEALLRWTSAQIGTVGPDIFIPIAEQNGKITEIGRWVMEEACKIRASWKTLGINNIKVSINLSPVQMLSCNIHELVSNTLSKHHLDASAIALEITEGVLLDNCEDQMHQLKQLKALGISLYLDDFGTGYSSLSYVNQYPFDIIKMDKSFIQDIAENPKSRALATTIISMASNLGLEVIAEGVETQWQKEFLTRSGCHRIQGYYYGKPVSSDEFIKKWGGDVQRNPFVKEQERFVKV